MQTLSKVLTVENPVQNGICTSEVSHHLLSTPFEAILEDCQIVVTN